MVALGFTNIVFGNFFTNAWSKAVQQTLFEQDVEDRNAIHKIDNHLARRLIVMPLSETFNPNRANQMHGKVQYGDKCSLPSSIGRLIFEKPYEVPWLFEVVPVKSEQDTTFVFDDDESEVEKTQPQPSTLKKNLEKAYISPLDFRSPENYIFMPQWLMNSLGLKTNDLVDVSFVRIKLASLVVLQPMTLDWDELLENHGDPKTLLEHEINKYSSLTTGSTIAIEIGGKEYPLFVKDTKAENGVSMKGVRVQDADIKVKVCGAIHFSVYSIASS